MLPMVPRLTSFPHFYSIAAYILREFAVIYYIYYRFANFQGVFGSLLLYQLISLFFILELAHRFL